MTLRHTTLMPRRRRWPLLVAVVLTLHLPGEALSSSYASVLWHGARTRNVVALTFDDGWGVTNCGRVVDILMRTKTPATFLPTANWVSAAPTFWRHVADLGFPFANHSISHPHMTRLYYSSQFYQINTARLRVESIIKKPMVRVFRPPYGSYNLTTRRAAYAAGFPRLLLWDTTFADSSRRPGGGYWPLSSYLRSATKGIAGSVILGHCGSLVDYQILASVIASYRARGFTFVTVPQILGLPGATAMTFPG